MIFEGDLIIKEIIPRAYNVKSYRLALTDGFEFKAGQFLCCSLKTEHECKRYLSISNSPTEKGYIEFTKKITESEFSKNLSAMIVGEQLHIKYPFGNFIYDSKYKQIAFLSGGIGITPIRSILKFIVDSRLYVDAVLIYGNQAVRDILFSEDFQAMQKIYPKFRVHHVLCEISPGFECTTGLIDRKVIAENIPDYLSRQFYISGPPRMVSAMQKILNEDLGLAQQQIITENFQGY